MPTKRHRRAGCAAPAEVPQPHGRSLRARAHQPSVGGGQDRGDGRIRLCLREPESVARVALFVGDEGRIARCGHNGERGGEAALTLIFVVFTPFSASYTESHPPCDPLTIFTPSSTAARAHTEKGRWLDAEASVRDGR